MNLENKLNIIDPVEINYIIKYRRVKFRTKYTFCSFFIKTRINYSNIKKDMI